MVMKQLLFAFAAAVLWSSELVSAQANFQFYKLSLIWPNSYCKQVNCINPIPQIFTIHGLWPTFQNDAPVPWYDPIHNPCYFNPASPQAVTGAVASILAGLQAKWPNIVRRSGANPNQFFWQLEWVRHGVCSDYGNNPLSYFTIALNLANDNRLAPFTAMGVQPSTTTSHQISNLVANVKTRVGFYPQISCFWDGQKLYLKEFRFCFVRAMPPSHLQDCPRQIDTACGSVQNSVWIP